MAKGKTDITIDLNGLEEIKRICRELPPRAIKKAFRRAFSLAGTPIQRTMKRLIRKKTGLLRRSIKKKLLTYDNGATVCIIGPDRNVEAPKAPATRGPNKGKERWDVPWRYSHLVDKGHGGPHPAPAHEFRTPALEQNRANVESTVKRVLLETLEAEAKKLGGK